jgi:hypothetical protein
MSDGGYDHLVVLVFDHVNHSIFPNPDTIIALFRFQLDISVGTRILTKSDDDWQDSTLYSLIKFVEGFLGGNRERDAVIQGYLCIHIGHNLFQRNARFVQPFSLHR